jgi:hypothetical protein
VAFLWAGFGIALIAGTASEAFSDLFRPTRSGALSDWIGRTLYDGFKRFPHLLPLAGPLTLMSVIAGWVAGLMFGFALVYFPAYPAAFRTSTGAVPPASLPFLSAVYFSFETLTTLGYGDIVPETSLVRFVANAEGLVGFGLLTASVSSIVLLYPALSRMRLLARGVSHIVDAERTSGIALAATGSDVTLSGLARDVTQARIDLIHFPIVYYFASNDVNARVARWVHDLARLANDATEPVRPAHVRFAGAALHRALDDFAQIVEERFLHTGSRDRASVLDALAKDQLVDRQARPSVPTEKG